VAVLSEFAGGSVDLGAARDPGHHRVHHGVYLFGTDVMLSGGPELAAVLVIG
jgi:hypothetical protein